MDEYGSTGGSLLTVAFQILVDSVPTAKLSLGSVATVNNLIACTFINQSRKTMEILRKKLEVGF
uniref:HD-Zip IV C-terminal domain-containing protein n=1 Tax=Salix viminalis TaxID=40686 RepID=A0A6N2NE29_SALVM